MSKRENTKYSSRNAYKKTDPLYKFGTRLKAQMKKKGIRKQAVLAEMMDVSESSIKDWVQHYTFPGYDNLAKLCRIFAPCSADYFMGTIEEPNYDLQFIMNYTGLSSDAIERLHTLYIESKYTEMHEEESSAEEVTEFDPNRLYAERRAQSILNLLNAMLNWKKENSNEELLSLMELYISADIQNITYRESGGKTHSGFPLGEMIATDNAGRLYHVQTANIIKNQLEQPIINALKEIADAQSRVGKVHHSIDTDEPIIEI